MFRKVTLTSLLLVVGSSLAVFLAPTSSVTAATAENCTRESTFLGFPTWYKYLNPQFLDNECNISFDFPQDIGLVLAAVIELLLRVAMLISIGFVVYGGIQFILSQGEPDRLSAARSTLVNALIGLVIAITATAIVTFVAGRFTPTL